MWTQYFNFIKLRRGRVIVPIHGEIDFSRDDIPLETCKELFESGFPYLELTELGKKKLHGTAKISNFATSITSKSIEGREHIQIVLVSETMDFDSKLPSKRKKND